MTLYYHFSHKKETILLFFVTLKMCVYVAEK